MLENGIVKKILQNEMVEVEIHQGEGCASCNGCLLALGDEGKCPTVSVNNVYDKKVGDAVVLEISSKNFYFAFFLIFVIPLFVFIVSALLFTSFQVSDGIAFILSFILFLASFYIAKMKERQVSEEKVYKIIE